MAGLVLNSQPRRKGGKGDTYTDLDRSDREGTFCFLAPPLGERRLSVKYRFSKAQSRAVRTEGLEGVLEFDGEPVAFARVILKGSGGFRRTTTTAAGGGFGFAASRRRGLYRLSIKATVSRE